MTSAQETGKEAQTNNAPYVCRRHDMHVTSDRLTLPVAHGLIDHAGFGGKCHRASGPLLGRPMGAVNAPNANLPDMDGPILAALLLAVLDVFGRGLEIFELPAEEGQAVG